MVDIRTHAHTNTHTHTSTHWWHTSQQEHRFSGFLSCVQTQLSEYTGPWGSGNFSLKFHAYFRPLFLLTLACVHFFVLFVFCFSFLYNAWYTDAGIVILSQLPLSWIKPPFVTHLHPYPHTHDTIQPQEKPWARTGRKTLENQDTIWHLWSLNDFLLGVGLRPTGKSQKTGRENYIRENVYAAHSAPSLFAPQMSDYSSTLNLWERGGWCREGDSFHH